MLAMPTEPLIEWNHVLHEFFEFFGAILALGAVGFRFVVLTAARQQSGMTPADDPVLARMQRPAAFIGLAGAVLVLHHVAAALPAFAQRQHVTVFQALTTYGGLSVAVWAFALATLGFAFALFGARWAWALAGAGVVVGVLRAGLFGQWDRLLKPAHLFVVGLWIGTLLVLVAVGLVVAMRATTPPDRRGRIAAGLVNAFSPFALTLGAAVATFGGILALRELPSFSALWTTPYGTALSIKLAIVAVVFGLGAWNGFRLRPRLGDEAAVPAIRRSATAELAVAFVVIVVTAVLATLPSPKPPVP
jgi:putative copper export protein